MWTVTILCCSAAAASAYKYLSVYKCLCVLCFLISCVCFQTSTTAPSLPSVPRFCIRTAYWDPTESTESDRSPCYTPVLSTNLCTSHPSFWVRYQANELRTHPQSMGFHLKARGINARFFCTPPTLWGRGEGMGKKWQDRFPMGCYSNDFCQSASFKTKVWGYISPPKECVKALYVANMFPAVS